MSSVQNLNQLKLITGDFFDDWQESDKYDQIGGVLIPFMKKNSTSISYCVFQGGSSNWRYHGNPIAVDKSQTIQLRCYEKIQNGSNVRCGCIVELALSGFNIPIPNEIKPKVPIKYLGPAKIIGTHTCHRMQQRQKTLR